MISGFSENDTICALATPVGTGGIAVIRISGAQALTKAKPLCPFLPQTIESHRVYYGHAQEPQSKENVDEVLATYFAQGRSFTGEETIEISCHGGTAIVARILKALVGVGCRIAGRGEFTFRAFMNGRLDLVQAEAVLALIESQSESAAAMALRQLQGELSLRFREIEDHLVWLLAQLEASIDYSTEGIEVVPSRDLLSRANQVLRLSEQMIKSYQRGRLLHDGLRVCLVGQPNVGKSSLLNRMLEQERAIVTDQAGTTRDLIEARISIQGVPVTLIDTAGFRATENIVEKLGVEKSKEAFQGADCVWVVVDAAAVDMSIFDWLPPLAKHQSLTLVLNKTDLLPSAQRMTPTLPEAVKTVFWVSSKSGQGFDELKVSLQKQILESVNETSQAVLQARHVQSLEKIHLGLLRAIEQIQQDASPDFIAFELQEAVREIHLLLGKEFDEQVIERIFQEFCIGK